MFAFTFVLCEWNGLAFFLAPGRKYTTDSNSWILSVVGAGYGYFSVFDIPLYEVST